MEERDNNSTDLRQLLRTVLFHWRWVGVSVVVGTVAFAVVALMTTPIYRGSVLLVPANSGQGGLSGALNSAVGQLGGLASLAGISVGAGETDTEESLAVLTSRQFTEVFITENQLMPFLFAKRWDKAGAAWKPGIEPPTMGKAVRYFNNAIRRVAHDRKTGLVTVHVDWEDREQAAVWANQMVQRLNKEMRARAIAKSENSVGYLEKELESTTAVATREAINRLIEAQVKQRMMANVTEEYAFRVVDRAAVPDADDRLKPKRTLMVLGGFVTGLALGICAVLLFARAPTPLPATARKAF